MVNKVLARRDFGELSSAIKWVIWPSICLAAAIILIVYRDMFPDWFVGPPDLWTEQLPLPYVAFENRMPVAMDWSGTNLADWFVHKRFVVPAPRELVQEVLLSCFSARKV